MGTILPIIEQIVAFGLGFAIYGLGMFGLHMIGRGEFLYEHSYPGVASKMSKFSAKWGYRLLTLSVPIILLRGHWEFLGFVSIGYLCLLPWIVFTRVKTWRDKSSLLDYRFIKSDFLRFWAIHIPVQVFGVFTVIHLLVIGIFAR